MNIKDLKKELSLHFLYLDVKDAGIDYRFYQDDLSYFEFNLDSTYNIISVHLRIKRNLKSLMIPTEYLVESNIVFYDDNSNEKIIIPCNKYATLINRGSYFEATLRSDSN